MGCGGDPGRDVADGARTTPGKVTTTSPRTQANVTIDAPSDGSRTTARSIVVTGTSPAVPRGGDALVTVTVNRRPVDVAPRRGTYRIEVALELGRNAISAKGQIYNAEGTEIGTTASGVIAVTRAPGAGTGVLDRATAYLAADSSDEVYSICGESEDCRREPHCFEVGPRRVDCPVGTTTYDEPISRCDIVLTVRLRGPRVYFGNYGCRGKLNPNPRRLVRRDVYRSGRRFRIDEREAPWLREEANEPNRYGVPRFDVDRDVFLP
jgi:hypothetical protein